MNENTKKGSFKVILISIVAVFLVAAVIISIFLLNKNKNSDSGNDENSTAAPQISQEESSEREISRDESKEESKQTSKEDSGSGEESSKEETEPEDSKAESSSEESRTENSRQESSAESSREESKTDNSREESRSEESKSESSREESKAESSKEESKKESSDPENREDDFPSNSGAYEQVSIEGTVYYHRLDDSLWGGNYHQDNFETSYGTDTVMKVVGYDEYLEILDGISKTTENSEPPTEYMDITRLKPAYNDENMNYLLLSQSSDHGWCNMYLIDVEKQDDKLVVYGYENTYGVMASGSGYFIAIPTYMPVGTEVEYVQCHTSEEIENIKKFGSIYDPNQEIAYKPIIYLYPTEEKNVTVKLLKDDNLTCTYPKYKDEWNVTAKPNGDLVDLKTGRNLYSLYYECKNSVRFTIQKDGFVVKGEDAAQFLEEKLAVLGLSDREAEEFIVYWLPILEANKYNYIRFAEADEIEENMPLQVSSDPDSVIRVLMTFKGLDFPINVKEQKLAPVSRTGFTVVEWGGTEIR